MYRYSTQYRNTLTWSLPKAQSPTPAPVALALATGTVEGPPFLPSEGYSNYDRLCEIDLDNSGWRPCQGLTRLPTIHCRMNSTDALVSPVTYMWTLWMRAKKYFKSWTTAITVQYIPPNSSVPPPPPTFFRDAKSTQAMPSVFFRILFLCQLISD